MKFRLIIPLLLFIGIAACKKDTAPRSQTYNLVEQNGSGMTGSVTFKEEKGSQQTAIAVSLQNAVLGGYILHIHEGPVTSYHVILYNWGHAYPHNNRIDTVVSLPLAYDSAMNLNGTFVVHDSTESVIVAHGGVGRNK